MRFGTRGPRSSGTGQRKKQVFQPAAEGLEVKLLMATVQLGAGTPFNLAGQNTTAPNGPQTIGGQLPFVADSSGVNQVQGNQTTDPGLGILETGSLANQGVGFSVAALGDMNADGSNDYIVGAPTVSRTGAVITPSNGTNSQAFLVFGNRSAVVPTTQNWSVLTPEQRVGNINQLGNTSQTNPFTNRGQPYNYNYDGITFFTSQSPSSQLGAFVASAGPNAFLIGAPNYAGGGRLYYVTATSNFNALSNKLVDLDSPGQFPGLTIVTFTEPTNATSGLGTSAAYVPNLYGDGVANLAIGEPGANTTNGTNTGAVYVIQIPNIPANAGTNTVLTVSSTSGVVTFAGESTGDRAGASVANAGNVSGETGPSTSPINSIVIGAPGATNSQGRTYLVYGGSTLTSSFQGTVVNLNRIDLNPNNITAGSIPPPQGAVFQGTGTDQAGFAVSSAGDFNGDGLGDFMIGSPGAGGSAGRVNLFYGVAPTTSVINGFTVFTTGLVAFQNGYQPIQLNAVPSNFSNWTFTGASGGDRAGYSLSPVPSTESVVPILIGAPGWNAGQGSVYELGRASGTSSINSFQLNNSNARQYTLTFPTTFQSTNAINFGISVSAFSTTAGDFIAGAPGYTGTLPTTTVTPPTPLVGAAPVVIESLQVSPIPVLGGGVTPPPNPGGGGVSGGGLAGAILPGLFQSTSFIPPFGSSFVPSVSSLSTFNYAPIPLNVALQQYGVPDGFKQRFYAYYHPGSSIVNRGQNRSRNNNSGSGRWTLGRNVFTRGRFHQGKSYEWTHNVNEGAHSTRRVVPVTMHTTRYTSQGKALG